MLISVLIFFVIFGGKEIKLSELCLGGISKNVENHWKDDFINPSVMWAHRTRSMLCAHSFRDTSHANWARGKE